MLLTGAQIIIKVLIEQGVDTVFGYPGGTVLHIYDELYKNSGRIRHYTTCHEQGASHAADGYARASGKTGVVIATSGPGARFRRLYRPVYAHRLVCRTRRCSEIAHLPNKGIGLRPYLQVGLRPEPLDTYSNPAGGRKGYNELKLVAVRLVSRGNWFPLEDVP